MKTCQLERKKINLSARRCVFSRKWVKLTQDELLSIFKSVLKLTPQVFFSSAFKCGTFAWGLRRHNSFKYLSSAFVVTLFRSDPLFLSISLVSCFYLITPEIVKRWQFNFLAIFRVENLSLAKIVAIHFFRAISNPLEAIIYRILKSQKLIRFSLSWSSNKIRMVQCFKWCNKSV